ncbi:sporulation protein YqfD [Metallumcola ferriviriculae]|uniref:Sporulation protein YqfD n=1 Tax=Metallumcola ferriviriculae TaxID=3039180 RepID=A0AAU0UIZ1_9FIRM|nr:sporulation protein YqfD [Desulfitibacteraceae bacterium MK1]
MLVRKLWALFWGYVTIGVEGVMLERFLNLAVARNISFWDVNRLGKNRLAMKVKVSGFKSLRHVGRTTRCRIRIESKHGLPFLWMRIKKRKMLAVGLLVFLIGIQSFSSFIWNVEVISKEELQYLTVTEIEEQLSTLGLRPGAMKRNVDLREVERQLEASLPKLSWAGATFQGTKVYVEVVEKTLPPDDADQRTPANIVANKDGFIEDVLVIAGEARVQPGDAVTRGQVLISGVIYPQQPAETTAEGDIENEELIKPRYVHAQGVVKARVWYRARGEADLVERGEKKTGRKATRISIKLGDKEIIIKGPRQTPFKYFQLQEDVKTIPRWRNLNPSVELSTTTYHEVERYQMSRSREEAVAIAAEQAAGNIIDRIPAGAKVIDKKSSAVLSGGKATVSSTWEVVEDIGRTKLLH